MRPHCQCERCLINLTSRAQAKREPSIHAQRVCVYNRKRDRRAVWRQGRQERAERAEPDLAQGSRLGCGEGRPPHNLRPPLRGAVASVQYVSRGL